MQTPDISDPRIDPSTAQPAPGVEVELGYIAPGGEFQIRHVIPDSIFLGDISLSQPAQWFLKAYDVVSKQDVTLEMKGIGVWRPRGKGRRRD